ncbi:MAG: DUF5597 domain-containing protein [Anaerolineae bacterium]
MSKTQHLFTVDGQPFYPIGGQTRNSSGYNEEEWSTAFHALDLLHGNTLEIPVYWEQVEPEEGIYNFTYLDDLINTARHHDVRLVLLWFGTWKNGNMEYAPAWVKTDPERFKRVISPTGRPVWVLSSHCAATFEADRRAFSALCRHLKEVDAADQTVIAVQIENEPGILGADRDYGGEAQAVFEAPVPRELLENLRESAAGPVHAAWQKAGGRPSGSWPEIFGERAGELLTGWSIARYIDRLAEAGKAIYELPMYLNVWLGEGSWRIPGETYPSGGAVTQVLDLYKWATPHVDLIAPDIYIADANGYAAICRAYAREDNPLFIPESAPGSSNPWRIFQAVADYDAIGYAFFAIERIVGEDGDVRPELQPLVDSFRAIAAAIPLLLKYQGTGQVHAVIQEEHLGAQHLDLDGYIGLVEFGAGPRDWRHPGQSLPVPEDPSVGRGRGLVFQTSRHEFYLVGANYRLQLRPKTSPAEALDASLSNDRLRTRLAHYVQVDEGRFEKDGRFTVERRRNGDETDHGIWVEPDVRVVHVQLCE